jgi:hypothetical protein
MPRHSREGGDQLGKLFNLQHEESRFPSSRECSRDEWMTPNVTTIAAQPKSNPTGINLSA